MAADPNQLFQRLARKTHLLNDFLAVARAGGIRQASEQVHISQSALTRRIQELERALDVSLFERSVQGMSLSTFGVALLHHAELLEMNCIYAATEVGDLLQGSAGELRIAAGPAWAYELAPDAVAAAKVRLPNVRFNVLTRMNDVTLPMLSSGQLDVVLGGLPPDDERSPDLQYEPVLDVEYRIFAGAGHPLQSSRRQVKPRDLVSYPWVWSVEAVTARAVLVDSLRQAGLALPPSSIETTSVHLGFRVLRDGSHLMLLPSTLASAAALHDLSPLQIAGKLGNYSAGLMYRASVRRLRAFVEFREALLRNVAHVRKSATRANPR